MPRSPRLLAALVAALLTVATAVATATTTTTSVAVASARAPMLFDVGSAGTDDATRDATLATLDGLGVRAIRVGLIWARVAPDPSSAQEPAFDATDPDAYDWGGTGRLIDAAHARGWKVVVTFSAPVPRWATAARRDQVTRPSPAAFAAFTTAAGRRFGAAVDTWGLWNEPNHPQFLQPQYVRGQPASPAIYRRLHAAGVAGLLAAGQGADTMLAGETAPGGDRHKSVPPLQFLRGVFCHGCAMLRVDGWAHHPYANRRGPFYRSPDPDNVTIGVLSRLERALDRVGEHRLAVWITEFGIQSTPDTILGVPLAQQAEFRSLSEQRLIADPRVAASAQYLLDDDVALSGFQTGLVRADGRAKPSLAEFRLPLTVRGSGAQVRLWGLIRPAAAAGTATRVELLVRDPGHATTVVASRPTDASGQWTARLPDRAHRTWQVRWTAPDGTAYTGAPTRAYA